MPLAPPARCQPRARRPLFVPPRGPNPRHRANRAEIPRSRHGPQSPPFSLLFPQPTALEQSESSLEERVLNRNFQVNWSERGSFQFSLGHSAVKVKVTKVSPCSDRETYRVNCSELYLPRRLVTSASRLDVGPYCIALIALFELSSIRRLAKLCGGVKGLIGSDGSLSA